MPTLSKTTLYNTMQLFLEKGLVMLITINENEAHYDADTSPHGHFRCSRCGHIYDTVIDAEALKFEGMEDFEVHDCHIYFWGLCPRCLEKDRDK
jgi:Fe2+ or Zn2+ uptake regulation protein